MGYLHDPTSASIEDRAATCLILLYAQSAAKIVTLTTSDIHTHDGYTYLALGREPVRLLPPLGGWCFSCVAVTGFRRAVRENVVMAQGLCLLGEL